MTEEIKRPKMHKLLSLLLALTMFCAVLPMSVKAGGPHGCMSLATAKMVISAIDDANLVQSDYPANFWSAFMEAYDDVQYVIADAELNGNDIEDDSNNTYSESIGYLNSQYLPYHASIHFISDLYYYFLRNLATSSDRDKKEYFHRAAGYLLSGGPSDYSEASWEAFYEIRSAAYADPQLNDIVDPYSDYVEYANALFAAIDNLVPESDLERRNNLDFSLSRYDIPSTGGNITVTITLENGGSVDGIYITAFNSTDYSNPVQTTIKGVTNAQGKATLTFPTFSSARDFENYTLKASYDEVTFSRDESGLIRQNRSGASTRDVAAPIISFGAPNQSGEVLVTIIADVDAEVGYGVNSDDYTDYNSTPFTISVDADDIYKKIIRAYAYVPGYHGNVAEEVYNFEKPQGAFYAVITPVKNLVGPITNASKVLANLSSENATGGVTYRIVSVFSYEDVTALFRIDGDKVYIKPGEEMYSGGYAFTVIANDGSDDSIPDVCIVDIDWDDEPAPTPSRNSGGSSGGGGGGGGGGGSSSRTITPPTISYVSSNVAAATGEVSANAVSTELTKELAKPGDKAVLSTRNAQTISPAIIKSLAAQAKKAGKTAALNADTLTADGKTVQGRFYVEPEKLTNLNSDLKLGVYTDKPHTEKTETYFKKWFVNKIVIVDIEQKGSLGARLQLAALANLTGFNTQNLYLYSYDVTTNTYKFIENSAYRIDKNGYLHFYTEVGGDIIVTDSPLKRR